MFRSTFRKYYIVPYEQRAEFVSAINAINTLAKVKLEANFDEEKRLWYVEAPSFDSLFNTNYPELQAFEASQSKANISTISGIHATEIALHTLRNAGFDIDYVKLTGDEWIRAKVESRKKSNRDGSYCFKENADGTYFLSFTNFHSNIKNSIVINEKELSKSNFLSQEDKNCILHSKAWGANQQTIRQYKEQLLDEARVERLIESISLLRKEDIIIPYSEQVLKSSFFSSDIYFLRKELCPQVQCYVVAKDYQWKNPMVEEEVYIPLSKGSLLIPILNLNTGIIQSVQMIAPAGNKLFLKNGKAGAGISNIRSKYSRGVESLKTNAVFLCEGLATASSIYQILERLVEENKCSPHYVVVATFSISNLETIAYQLAKTEKSPLFICCDNDHKRTKEGKVNVGLTKGEEICSRIKNAYLVSPDFADFGEAGANCTDWNDWLLHVKKNFQSEVLLKIKKHFLSLLTGKYKSSKSYFK